MPRNDILGGKASAVFLGTSSAAGLIALSVASVITIGWLADCPMLVMIVNLLLSAAFAIINLYLVGRWRKSDRKKEATVFSITHFGVLLLEIGILSLHLQFHDYTRLLEGNAEKIVRLQSASLLIIGLSQLILLTPAIIRAMSDYFHSLNG